MLETALTYAAREWQAFKWKVRNKWLWAGSMKLQGQKPMFTFSLVNHETVRDSDSNSKKN